MTEKKYSRKFIVAKSVLAFIAKIPWINQNVRILSETYIDICRGYKFSYLTHENGESEFIRAIVRSFPRKFIFFDVGAHHGTYTNLVLESHSDYKGHLFELTKATYDRCMMIHGSNKMLTINNTALSDYEGEIEYRSYPADPTRNGISGVGVELNFEYSIERANCTTGDKYCAESGVRHINLLKIDAEGYDLHVLRGFSGLLSKGLVDVIQFEYNFRHGDMHVVMRDFYNFFREYGYELGPLRKFGVDFFDEFDSRENSFERGPNYVACLPKLRSSFERF